MKIARRFKLAATASVIGLSFSAMAATPPATSAAPSVTHDATKPSVVIVHGAFADGSDWAKVIPLLQAKGLHVVAVQNPLTSLEDDVAAARRAIDAQPGKVVLVGHSWGGSVITEAGADDKVSRWSTWPPSRPTPARPAPSSARTTRRPRLRAHRGRRERLPVAHQGGHGKHFAQDLPASATAVMTATQGPILGKSFEQKLSVAAWKTKPSWYLAASADHMIQPALQLDMAKKIGAHLTAREQQPRAAAIAAGQGG
jgi:pimeloyl-ACP methyl ester carboxylesterase